MESDATRWLIRCQSCESATTTRLDAETIWTCIWCREGLPRALHASDPRSGVIRKPRQPRRRLPRPTDPAARHNYDHVTQSWTGGGTGFAPGDMLRSSRRGMTKG